jgi:predicted component of type VI protein secretion system
MFDELVIGVAVTHISSSLANLRLMQSLDEVVSSHTTPAINSLLPTFMNPEDMGDLSRRLVHLYHASHRIFPSELEIDAVA